MSEMSTRPSHAPLRTSGDRALAARKLGQMTAAMHVLPKSHRPKVLRIALVRGGAIVDERVVKDLRDVTIGSSERATFVLADPTLPPTFKLFQRVRGAYLLNLLDVMRGRVALESGVTEVAAFCAGSQRVVELTDDARGKIVLGAESLVFQFVDAPVATKPQLPISIGTGLGIDWNLTFIAAMSFLVHFGLVGAMYSDFVDPVVDQGATASLIDELRHMQSKAIPIETHASDAQASATSAADPSTTPTTAPTTPGLPRTGPAPTGNAPPRAVTAAEVRSALGDLVSVLTPTKSAAEVLRGDKVWVPFPSTTPTHAGDPLVIATHADPFTASRDPGPVNPSVTPVEKTAGPTKAPEIKFSFQAPLPPPPRDVPDLQSVLSRIAPQARACYQQGLARNPSQQGKVTIVAHIGPSGDVESVSVQNQGLDTGTASCIAGRVRAAHFKTGGANGTTVGIPFIFMQQ